MNKIDQSRAHEKNTYLNLANPSSMNWMITRFIGRLLKCEMRACCNRAYKSLSKL